MNKIMLSTNYLLTKHINTHTHTHIYIYIYIYMEENNGNKSDNIQKI